MASWAILCTENCPSVRFLEESRAPYFFRDLTGSFSFLTELKFALLLSCSIFSPIRIFDQLFLTASKLSAFLQSQLVHDYNFLNCCSTHSPACLKVDFLSAFFDNLRPSLTITYLNIIWLNLIVCDKISHAIWAYKEQSYIVSLI